MSGLDADRRELQRQTPVPIAIDESSALPGALDERVCDAVCLKISRCGGITGIVDRGVRRARAAGYEVYLASTLDGPLGIAAALHAAAAIGPDRPCGLATLPMFEGRTDPMPARRRAACAPPPAPGSAMACSAGTALADSPQRRASCSTAGDRGADPRGERRGRHRERTISPSRSSAAIRSAIAMNFSSRSPTTSTTGICSSPSCSQTDGSDAGPEPAQRPRQAAPACSAGGWRARAHATFGGWPSSTGRLLPPPRDLLDAARGLDPVRQRARRPARGPRRSIASAIPGLAPISTSRSIRPPSISAACSAIRPPIE